MNLTNDEYIEFRKQLKETLKEFPSLRKGQIMFNVLYEVKPELADKIRSSNIDPFYNDNNIPEFMKYINK